VTNGSGNREKAIDLAFDIYDSDNNGKRFTLILTKPIFIGFCFLGKISKKEMDQIIGAIYEMTGQSGHVGKSKVNEIFKRFDTDHNNSLDKQEFIHFIVHDPVASQAFNH